MSSGRSILRGCPACFTEPVNYVKCPVCGYPYTSNKEHVLPISHVVGGRYWIGHFLGQGGFGVTYKAYDLRLGKIVALKEYFPQGICFHKGGSVQCASDMSEDFERGKSRFLKEAQNMAEFEGNANIVSVLDHLEDRGTAFLVMRYYEGSTLLKLIQNRSGRLSFKEAMRYLGPVMQALEVVHSKGYLHRDISPDNIFVTDKGESVLLDFGAAKLVFSERARSSLTMTSKVVKHGYSPPEQYSSDIRKIGFQSDIYALGATFYKVLSGRDPVYALERTIDGTPLPPIGEELAPSRARAAIHSAMSLEIGERPKSVEIFRKELESTLKEQKKGLMDYLPHTMWYAGFCVLWMTLVLAIYLWQQSR